MRVFHTRKTATRNVYTSVTRLRRDIQQFSGQVQWHACQAPPVYSGTPLAPSPRRRPGRLGIPRLHGFDVRVCHESGFRREFEHLSKAGARIDRPEVRVLSREPCPRQLQGYMHMIVVGRALRPSSPSASACVFRPHALTGIRRGPLALATQRASGGAHPTGTGSGVSSMDLNASVPREACPPCRPPFASQ